VPPDDLICAALGERGGGLARPAAASAKSAPTAAQRAIARSLAQNGVAWLSGDPDPEQAARLGFVSAVAGAAANCWSPHDAARDFGDSRLT
jgi:hypothetical protein